MTSVISLLFDDSKRTALIMRIKSMISERIQMGYKQVAFSRRARSELHRGLCHFIARHFTPTQMWNVLIWGYRVGQNELNVPFSTPYYLLNCWNLVCKSRGEGWPTVVRFLLLFS